MVCTRPETIVQWKCEKQQATLNYKVETRPGHDNRALKYEFLKTKTFGTHCPPINMDKILPKLKYFFIFVFLAGFVAQVLDQIIKFLGGRITTTSYPRYETSAFMPSISFCPGFKIQAAPNQEQFTAFHGRTTFFDVYPWPEGS